MSRRINRNDPAYEQAMREAKALFDAAMAKSAMKGRGRPPASAQAQPAVASVATAVAPATDADLVREIGDDMPEEAKAIVAPKAAAAKGGKSAKPAKVAAKVETPVAPAEKKRVVRRPKKEQS